MKNKLTLILILFLLFLAACNTDDIELNNKEENYLLNNDVTINDEKHNEDLKSEVPTYGLDFYKTFKYEIESIECFETIYTDAGKTELTYSKEEFDKIIKNNEFNQDYQIPECDKQKNIPYNELFSYQVGDVILDCCKDRFGICRWADFGEYKKCYAYRQGNMDCAQSWDDLSFNFTYIQLDSYGYFSSDYNRELLYSNNLYIEDCCHFENKDKKSDIVLKITLKHIDE